MSKNIVIVGGGIIGLCSAYFLNKEGNNVTVIDQFDISSGASFVNAGYISPSHVIPLSSPGMVASGIKMMFNQSSPFYLKPRFDFDLFKWMWHFNKSATSSHVAKVAPIIKELTVMSRDLLHSMKNEKLFDFHFEIKGLLMVYQTDKFEEKEAKIADVARNQGLKVDHISTQELKNMEPSLKAKGAFYYHDDAHSTPIDYMPAFKKYLTSQGVIFKKNEKVIDIATNNSIAVKLTTSETDYTFDELLIAAGSWTPILAEKLHFKLLVQAGKGYRIDVKRPTGINYPAILSERNTAVTPMEGFTRFGGTMEISGINSKINNLRVQQIAKNAAMYYPKVAINESEIENVAFGLRPLSPDGMPFIGRVPSFKNVSIATGHAMMGWSQAHATGMLISEIIEDKKPSLDLSYFALDRF